MHTIRSVIWPSRGFRRALQDLKNKRVITKFFKDFPEYHWISENFGKKHFSPNCIYAEMSGNFFSITTTDLDLRLPNISIGRRHTGNNLAERVRIPDFFFIILPPWMLLQHLNEWAWSGFDPKQNCNTINKIPIQRISRHTN